MALAERPPCAMCFLPLTHLILKPTLQGKHDPLFTDEKMKFIEVKQFAVITVPELLV